MSHIKLHGVKPRIQYVADGTLTTYEFPFVIFTNMDIQVYLNNILQTPETYTVSGVKNTNGGSITFMAPPTNGTIITITRDLSIERTTDFQEGGALRANTLNDEFDYQTACLQQVADSINRSMILPPYATDTNVDLTLPMPSAGKAIVWNKDGTNLENSAVKVNELESTLRVYKESAESSATIASQKAEIASNKANTATEQAQVATEKASLATQKATETANSLSTKANKDMDNLTEAGKTRITSFGMPDYSAGISIANNETFTAPCDGVYVGSTSGTKGDANAIIDVGLYDADGNLIFNIGNRYGVSSRQGPASIVLPIPKGYQIKIEEYSYGVISAFYPLTGAN